jgi:hypothetical protein
VQGCPFRKCKRVFTVEHCLASRSYLTCRNEFRDTFPDSFVPFKSTLCRLVNRFRDRESVEERKLSGRSSVLNDDLEEIRQTLLYSPRKPPRKLSFKSGSSCRRVQVEYVSGMVCETFRSLCAWVCTHILVGNICCKALRVSCARQTYSIAMEKTSIRKDMGLHALSVT